MCVSESLQVRLAQNAAEIDAAQALRYRVFYDEMGAQPTHEMAAIRRGLRSLRRRLRSSPRHRPSPDAVVGTYRLIRRGSRSVTAGFYSASEYNLGAIPDHRRRGVGARPVLHRRVGAQRPRCQADVARHRGLCVPPQHRADVRLRQPRRHRSRRACLAARLSPSLPSRADGLRVRAVPDRFVAMDRLPKPRSTHQRASFVAAFDQRLSALGRFRRRWRGDRSAIQHRPMSRIVVKTDLVTDKYYRYYERRNARESAHAA